MKCVLIIGIGAGDPDYITMQAVKALNRVDVFFLMDKGPAKRKLRTLREELCRQHIKDRTYRFVEAPSPPRDMNTADYRGSGADYRPSGADYRASGADYRASVDDLNREKQAVFEAMISAEMKDGETAGILVWGDPMLYDSTIRNLEAIAAKGGHDIDWEVIPGITAVQALAARHRIPLNRIAEPVALTTGRRLAEGFPPGIDSVAVLLDGEDTYRRFADPDLHGDVDIWWGAYLGTPDEILIRGKVAEVAEEIHRRRHAARAANGWVMDTYVLRKGRSSG
jgi:precorrin-6A synthase